MNIPGIGIGPLGSSEWSVGGLGAGTPSAGGAGGTAGTGEAGGGSFGSALTNAISSLDASQTSADQTAQQLATGQITDPTKAITAVENASLAMDYASQIRNQIDSAATTIFQTQM
jgi:flagellar hook-basal body complex protein FliE